MIGWKNDRRPAIDEGTPLGLYRSASAMENRLRAMMSHDPYAPLTGEPAEAYNRLVDAARRLVPNSVALREDVDPVDAEHEMAIDDAFRAVHVTLLPVIHNALPETEYAAV